MRKNEHYVVFGEAPRADKGVLAYKDPKTGMYCVKILQLTSEIDTVAGFGLDEIEGEYITMYFAQQRGRLSLDMLIDVLTELRKLWEKEEQEG